MLSSCKIGRATVANYLKRAADAGIAWPLPEGMTEPELQARLFPQAKAQETSVLPPNPDWNLVHQELQKKGVTLFLLWEEYKNANPDGYQYSWFCREYRNWRGKLDLVMRQSHRAGEKLFVDYAGHTIPIADSATGEVTYTEIFIAVLGANSYTYAEATWTQSLPDWIRSHVRAFEYM